MLILVSTQKPIVQQNSILFMSYICMLIHSKYHGLEHLFQGQCDMQTERASDLINCTITQSSYILVLVAAYIIHSNIIFFFYFLEENNVIMFT